MKIKEPKIAEDEFRARWRRAYRGIERSFMSEVAGFAATMLSGGMTQQSYARKALLSAGIFDTLMAVVRASPPLLALLLLESMASTWKAFHTDCSVYDSAFKERNGILENLNGNYMPDHWLSEFLLEHAGLYHSENNIELCQLPGGSYYIYGDHPAISGKNSPVHLGVCQVFDKLEDLTNTLHIGSKDDLSKLTVEHLLFLYPKGKVSMNTYLSDSDKTVNLVFRRKGSDTYITDQETDAEYITEERFDDPQRYITITRLYAQGQPLSNARYMRKHP